MEATFIHKPILCEKLKLTIISYRYGLIKTGKSKNALSILSGGDDDDELSVRDTCLRPTGFRQSEILKAMDKKMQQKVLEEDPSVYMYDEIYEQIVEEKVKSSTLLDPEKNVQHKPKYIQRYNVYFISRD